MKLFAALVAIGLGLLVLNAFLNWLTRDRERDYDGRGNTGMGNALLEIHSMLEPSRRHELKQRLEEPREEAEQGDPPSTESP